MSSKSRVVPLLAHLVTASELTKMLGSPTTPTILDVRWNINGPPARIEYEEGHIPGAIFVDLDRDLAAPANPALGRHPLPGPVEFQQTLRHWGLHAGDTVVAYDSDAGMSAARAWWLLRWAACRMYTFSMAEWLAGQGPAAF